ncbi:hypothetical protein BaRGS_00029718, partial [Batillaria attramentaria]
MAGQKIRLLIVLSSVFSLKTTAQPQYVNFVREDGSQISRLQAGQNKAHSRLKTNVGSSLPRTRFWSLGLEPNLTTQVVHANFTDNYTYTLNLEHQYLFIYSYNETNKTTAVRVSVASTDANGTFPIMFVVRQQEGILSWQVPIYIDYTRTLCPVDKIRRKTMTSEQLIYVDVSTMSRHSASFNLSAELLEDFQLSPSEPQYFMYEFPEGVETVLLRVTSKDKLCTVVSVQQIKCPIFDLDRNIAYEGKHQTMTTQASIFLQRSDYADFDAFYVVIFVKPNNADCSVPDEIQPAGTATKKYKNLSISITPTLPSEWLMTPLHSCEALVYLVMAQRTMKEVVRTKTMLFVSDLSRKSHKKLSKTFKIYHWNLLTIAIFYGLPVAQLVLTYQQVLLRTGDQDLCYYNFACAHPISRISAFNNVISNMGYVLLGLLFIILVWRRDLLHRTLLKENPQLERRYGIPQHYGLLYSMGVALVMEGIMSACYHVCPNYSNFQFDTSFMYIIACLCMLKIYETRHPDVQAKAYKSYFSMAMIIFIAVLGVIYGTNIFWIFYALIHMFSTLVLSVNIYYVGRINLDRYVFKRMAQLIISECFNCVRPIYPGRFVMLLLGNLINWALALYGAIKHPSDFASYLLAILIGNLLLYVLFYIVMKLVYRERINALTGMVILVSCVTWGAALYFFFQHLTSWQ